MYRCGALYQTIYMTIIGYTICTKMGVIVDA